METNAYLPSVGDASRPHSLGKLIEWKLQRVSSLTRLILRPHSLGKLIEWKRYTIQTGAKGSPGPHSLGKLIEWKLVCSLGQK